jgi:hypothetical protein
MMTYDVEFIRQMPGRDEPAVIETYELAAADLDEAIHRAGLSLLTISFRIKPETFRIRETNGTVVF